MFDRILTRTASFGLAAMVTLGLLSGIGALAVQQHAGSEIACAAPAATTAQDASAPKAAVVRPG